MDSRSHARPRVLAVDDKPSNLIALEAVLGRDHDMVFASSGAEALAILEARQDIDVILLDVQMPGIDGYEAASRIKKLPGCEVIPIVFVTAVYNEDPHIKRGYEVGGIDYFAKPFDPDILRMKVGAYASFRQRGTMLKERETRLRESERLLKVGRKLSSVLEDLPVGVIIADASGRICQTNEEMLRIVGASTAIDGDAYGEVLGWWDRGGNAIKDSVTPLLRALEHGETSRQERVSIRCLDGTIKKVLQSTSPLRGDDAHVVGAVIVLQDITKHETIEAEIEERIATLVSVGVELEEHAERA